MKQCTYEKLRRSPPERLRNLENTFLILAVTNEQRKAVAA